MGREVTFSFSLCYIYTLFSSSTGKGQIWLLHSILHKPNLPDQRTPMPHVRKDPPMNVGGIVWMCSRLLLWIGKFHIVLVFASNDKEAVVMYTREMGLFLQSTHTCRWHAIVVLLLGWVTTPLLAVRVLSIKGDIDWHEALSAWSCAIYEFACAEDNYSVHTVQYMYMWREPLYRYTAHIHVCML